jgi:hypothetical protein
MKMKRLEKDNCNNVPTRTNLNSERQREYRETHENLYGEYMSNYRQRKTQEIKTPQAGNSHAAYMGEYRKRKRLEEANCNNASKRTKLNTERQRECRETHRNISAENLRNYRKRKTQEKAQENKIPQASTSTDPTPTPNIYNYNHANEYFQKILNVEKVIKRGFK